MAASGGAGRHHLTSPEEDELLRQTTDCQRRPVGKFTIMITYTVGMVTPSHKVVRLPMIMFMHMVGLVNLASRSSRRKIALILYLAEKKGV